MTFKYFQENIEERIFDPNMKIIFWIFTVVFGSGKLSNNVGRSTPGALIPDSDLMIFISGVSSHVLDTSIGQPGRNIELKVFYQDMDGPVNDGRWNFLRTL